MIQNGTRTIGRNELMRLAPSAFAAQPHDSRSERYTYIPTVDLIERIVANGFDLVQAKQGRSRIPGKAAFTKHALVFRQRNAARNVVGDSVAQVLLTNSHDGTSAYKLMAGLFRFVCANGLVVSDGAFDCISVPHVGDVSDRVIEGTFTAIDAAGKAGERASIWRGITLSNAERQLFAREALTLRFGDDAPAPITIDRALTARRPEDRSTDLWTTFNVVQENLTQGGQRYTSGTRRARVRAVTGIDSNTALNRALWRLGDSMRALRTA